MSKNRLTMIGWGVAVLAAFLMLLDYHNCWRCSEGELYIRGAELLERDSSSEKRRGLKLIRAAAEVGHPEALATMGETHLETLPEGYRPIREEHFGEFADEDAALSYFELLAASEGADGRALFNLGILTREWKLPGEDEAYFASAAETGYLPAFYELGLLARDRSEYALASDYFKKACRQECLAEAALALGDLHFRGRGRVRDAERAIEWYRKGLEAAEGRMVAAARNRLSIAEKQLPGDTGKERVEIGYRLEGDRDEYLIYAGEDFIGRVNKEEGRVLAGRAGSEERVEAPSMNAGLRLVLEDYAVSEYGPEKDFRFELAGN